MRPHHQILTSLLAFAMLATPAMAQTRPPVERMPQVANGANKLPFSAGVRVGDMLYMSGVTGRTRDGKALTTMEDQARASLDRITDLLKSQGLGWKDVTRCLVMLKDMDQWPAFNTIYASYVDPENLPARSAFGASGLAMGALMEVQCDAYMPAK